MGPPKAAADRRRRLAEPVRLEFVRGAEEEWQRRTGRRLTLDELERVMRRYPGDPDDLLLEDTRWDTSG
jgi:hypothetical protein